MKNILKRIKFALTMTVLCLFLFGITGQAFAAKSTADDNARLALLSCAAYDELVVSNTTPDTSSYAKDNAEKTKKHMALKEDEFKKLAHDNLAAVVKARDNGKAIIWNSDFVENVIKIQFPDLYPAVSQQLGNQQQIVDSAVSAAYTAGSTNKTFSYYKYNLAGSAMCGMHSYITWQWDTTKLTSVVPSSWGEVYVPLWQYTGIVANNEGYTSSTEYHKFVKGQFQNIVGGVVIQTGYISLDIYERAGGDSSYTGSTT